MEKHKNIPKLRFPEFNGEWKIESTGNYIDLISGYAFKGDEISEDSDGIPILRGINITEGVIRHSDDIDRYFSGDISQLKKYLLRKGDIVLGMDGSKVGKNVAIISDKDENSLLIQRVAKINSNNKSDYRFIFQRIFSPVFHQYVDVVNTSSGIPHISLQQIRDFKVGYPSLPEQQKIASFFIAIDQKISQLKLKKTLLEKYKKGVIQKIFSQQIRFKDDNGQEFPKWEKKRLGSLLIERNTQAPKSDEYPLMAFVANKGVAHKGERYNREFLVNDGDSKKYKQTEYGDFIYSSNNLETGSIGMNCFGSASISPVYSIFQIRESCNSQFINRFLVRKSFINKMTKYRQGVVYGQWRIHESDFLKIEERIPSIEEQTKIATFLSATDEKINLTQKQIEKAEVWKKGLMQQMFV